MPIITLTTDFGNKDSFVASVKGKIYSELPEAIIVDVSHEIQPFDIAEGAFILRNAYADFPKGSIHIVGVDDLMTTSKRPIAALIDDHYFISVNNGILSLIKEDHRPQEIVEINIPQVLTETTFTARDIFVPVACHLVRGGKLSVVGQKLNEFKELSTLQPIVRDSKVIVGLVIYVDNYGNSITNISKSTFDKVGKKRKFRIFHRNHEFTTVHQNYNQILKDAENEESTLGNQLALFNSSGFLEIAIFKSNPKTSGSASTLLGLSRGSEVYVEFL